LVGSAGLLSGTVKAFAFESKYPVATRAVILPGDGSAQLYKLWRREPRFQSFAELRRYTRRSRRYGIGKLQDEFLIGIEEITVSVVVQVADLVVAESSYSAAGRVDVDSKRTFHQLGRAKLGKLLELC
jgi:hypothetical protein